MPDEQSTVHDAPPTDAHAPAAAQTSSYEPLEQEQEWLEEPSELPRRPRRRLLTPVPIALAAVLAIACGFIGGVLVEKGQNGASASAGAGAGFASRLAGLRGSAGGSSGSGAAGASASGAATPSGTSAAGSGGSARAGGGGGVTAGTVAYLSGNTLYVTTSEGNTVKVKTSAGSTVSKTVKATVKGIHPGETVLVTGTAAANGSVNAESIRVGASGAAGIGALLGGSRSGGSTGSTGAGSSGARSGSSGEPALFGNGG